MRSIKLPSRTRTDLVNNLKCRRYPTFLTLASPAGTIFFPASCCSYCSRERTSHFYPIVEGTKAGGQDWSPLVGTTLCHACYNRFRNGGKLERSTNKSLAAAERRCTYTRCTRPLSSSHFYTIEKGKSAGGKDWSELVGFVLCHACYKQFLQRGTLERSLHLMTSIKKPVNETARKSIAIREGAVSTLSSRPRRAAASRRSFVIRPLRRQPASDAAVPAIVNLENSMECDDSPRCKDPSKGTESKGKSFDSPRTLPESSVETEDCDLTIVEIGDETPSTNETGQEEHNVCAIDDTASPIDHGPDQEEQGVDTPPPMSPQSLACASRSNSLCEQGEDSPTSHDSTCFPHLAMGEPFQGMYSDDFANVHAEGWLSLEGEIPSTAGVEKSSIFSSDAIYPFPEPIFSFHASTHRSVYD